MGIQQRETNGGCATVTAPGGLRFSPGRKQGPCPAARPPEPAVPPRHTRGATARALTIPSAGHGPRIHRVTTDDGKRSRISHHNPAKNLGRWNRNAK